MDKIKNGAEEIYLAPETESSVELAFDEPIEEIENEDICQDILFVGNGLVCD